MILNVLMGGESGFPERLPAGRALFEGAQAGDFRLIVPANVIAELGGNPRIRGSHLIAEVRDHRLDEFKQWVALRRSNLTVEIDHRTALRAAELGAAHQLKGGDAMVLAGSLVAKCDVLYTWDKGLLKCDGLEGLMVREPTDSAEPISLIDVY